MADWYYCANWLQGAMIVPNSFQRLMMDTLTALNENVGLAGLRSELYGNNLWCRAEFDGALVDLYPVFQRKRIAFEHSILLRLMVARVAKFK